MLPSATVRASVPLALLLTAAADPSWRVKPISNWDESDARQVLTASPWVRKTKVGVIPKRGEDQMREGGRMGKVAGNAGSMNRDVTVRWESALPVRSAEWIAHEPDAPVWDGDYYAIAVYDVAGLPAGDVKSLASELKKTALLKREGKKDLRPSRVDVIPSASNLARIVYLFPRSASITVDDKTIEFLAQIGRLTLMQRFLTEEMLLQGKLEL